MRQSESTAAGGTVATAEAAKAAPAGDTMLLGFNGPLASGPLLSKLPYDVAKDLAPVIVTSSPPNVLAVNVLLPARNLQEFIAWLKESGTKATEATAGIGSTSHVTCAFFRTLTGKTPTPEKIEQTRLRLEQARQRHAKPTESPARKP